MRSAASPICRSWRMRLKRPGVIMPIWSNTAAPAGSTFEAAGWSIGSWRKGERQGITGREETMRLPKRLGTLLLGIWLIVKGVLDLWPQLSPQAAPVILAILAIAA